MVNIHAFLLGGIFVHRQILKKNQLLRINLYDNRGSCTMSDTTLESVDIYVPDYCVQGDRIPFYVLWDNNVKIQILITLPNGLALDEAYNIDSDSLKINGNAYIIDNFETNGYVGGVLSSTLGDRASIIKKIMFEVKSDCNIRQKFEREIELFRPDIKIDDSIGTINIQSDKNNRPVIREHIKISNHGRGTAIIRINILPDSEIKEGTPQGFEEFKLKFLEDLDTAFLEMKKKFPQHDKLLESLRAVSKNPLPSDTKLSVTVRKTVEDLESAFDNNEEFQTEFSRSVTMAYLKNVSIMTDADAFLAFLKSSGKNKLLILDAMRVFNVSPKTQTLEAELLTTDLANNEYPSKKLQPITIISDRSYSIPFYQIIDSFEVG